MVAASRAISSALPGSGRGGGVRRLKSRPLRDGRRRRAPGRGQRSARSPGRTTSTSGNPTVSSPVRALVDSPTRSRLRADRTITAPSGVSALAAVTRSRRRRRVPTPAWSRLARGLRPVAARVPHRRRPRRRHLRRGLERLLAAAGGDSRRSSTRFELLDRLCRLLLTAACTSRTRTPRNDSTSATAARISTTATTSTAAVVRARTVPLQALARRRSPSSAAICGQPVSGPA